MWIPGELLFVAASFSLSIGAGRCDDTPKGIERFAMSVKSAGGSIGVIGVPGHILALRDVPVFEVTIDGQWNSTSLDELDSAYLGGVHLTRDANICARTFTRLCEMSQIKSVSIEYGRQAAKWDLSSLGQLHGLWSLSIEGTRFSDDHLKTIGKLTQLQILSLTDTCISNGSGDTIRDMFPALIHLSIERCAVESPISAFVPHDIEVLSLRGFTLSDNDAEYIVGLPRLRILDLRDGRSRPEVVQRIRQNQNIYLVPKEIR